MVTKQKKSKTPEPFLGMSNKFWKIFIALSLISLGLVYMVFNTSAILRKSSYLVVINSIREYGNKDTVCYVTTGEMLDTVSGMVMEKGASELIYSERGKYNVGDTSLLLEDQEASVPKVGAH